MKTLTDLNDENEYDEELSFEGDTVHILTTEAINWINNLRNSDTQYPTVLDSLPETMKGSIPKKLWHKTHFRLGAEYGMISWIMYFFNLTEDDLK